MGTKVIIVGNICRTGAPERPVGQYRLDSCTFIRKLNSIAESFMNRNKNAAPTSHRKRSQQQVSTPSGTSAAPAGGGSSGGGDDSEDSGDGDGDGPGPSHNTEHSSSAVIPIAHPTVNAGTKPADPHSPPSPPKKRTQRCPARRRSTWNLLKIKGLLLPACVALTVLTGFLAVLQYDVSIALQIRNTFSLTIHARPVNAISLDKKKS